MFSVLRFFFSVLLIYFLMLSMTVKQNRFFLLVLVLPSIYSVLLRTRSEIITAEAMQTKIMYATDDLNFLIMKLVLIFFLDH